MDAQQSIFSKILTTLRGKGLDVYDGALPPKDTPYPFVYVGDSQTVDTMRKGSLGGSVYQTIHVWHNNYDERGTLSDIMSTVKNAMYEIDNATGWLLSEVSTQIVPDTTTDVPLMHGIINVTFKY